MMRARPVRRSLPALALIAVMVFAIPAAGAAATVAQRIVTIHLCADQLALLLAERQHVVSVSYLAADPEFSPVADLARGIPINHGDAEEVIAFAPDLVIAGRHYAGLTIRLLRRLGYRVLVLDTVNSLSEVRAQIETVGAAIGRPERARTLLDDLDRQLAAVARTADGPRPRAAIYHFAGNTIGADTLADDLIRLVGFDNYAAGLGISGYGYLSLERLIAGHPDVLIFDAVAIDAPAVGRDVLRHPALRALRSRVRTVTIPSRLWACSGTAIAEAARRLAEAYPR